MTSGLLAYSDDKCGCATSKASAESKASLALRRLSRACGRRCALISVAFCPPIKRIVWSACMILANIASINVFVGLLRLWQIVRLARS